MQSGHGKVYLYTANKQIYPPITELTGRTLRELQNAKRRAHGKDNESS